MNTTAKALIFAIVSVASAAAIGMGLADHAAQSTVANKAGVVKLERVVIVGKRVHVVAQLPQVVIEGRRSAA
ncbi:hypothetical protein SNE35_04750 [Paucibacter sp. R3-3]|uniref:Uncharacterized protein n=1 Tax=Roseateles agri TaxID=3098619 RepID=A0ABU5DBZ7_9BURK|nr:hypothetical protein [Paucibacter sp. R3-3]MDY0743798.1 hypothetical protein [Paucibacter sp. R3-3]